MDVSEFICSPSIGHLGRFQSGAFANIAARNILEPVFWWPYNISALRLPVIAFDKDRAYKNQVTTKPPTHSVRFPKKDEAMDLHVACLEHDYISAFERRAYHMWHSSKHPGTQSSAAK